MNLLDNITETLTNGTKDYIPVGISLNRPSMGMLIDDNIDCYGLVYINKTDESVNNEIFKYVNYNYDIEIYDNSHSIYANSIFTKALHELGGKYKYYYSNNETNRTISLSRYFVANLKLFGEDIGYMPYDLEITDITVNENIDENIDYVFHIDGNANVINEYIVVQ